MIRTPIEVLAKVLGIQSGMGRESQWVWDGVVKL